MTVDRTPEAVAERSRFIDTTLRWVDEWRDMARADGGALSTALLVACETITKLAAERDIARDDAALSLRQRQSLSTANMASEELRQRAEVERDEAIARAERAESLLATRTAAEYRAAFATDAAARAHLADERAGIPKTERDRRGVPLGTGAGVGGGAL